MYQKTYTRIFLLWLTLLTAMFVFANDLNANCGNYDKFNYSFGKIRFPSIGIVYSNNVDCRWAIDVAPNILRVEINNLDMDHDDYCNDYVAFYNDRTNENEISRYCLNKTVILYRKSGILYIKVATNDIVVASGFTLTWNSTTEENSQVLVSPKIKYETFFSGIHYADKSNAIFKCQASGTPAPYVYWDYDWKLFENFIFSESGFNLSYLKIISLPEDFRTQFVCRAISIAGTDKKELDVTTSDLNANCGNYDKFNNSFGKICFPSIGIEYSNNVECRWAIDVFPNILSVEINKLDMDYDVECRFDYVAFYDDPTNQNEISRHCLNKNVVLYRKSGILYIKVVTNAYIYASGFTLTWNSTTAKNSQVLVSPQIKYEAYFSGIHYADKSNATFKCEAGGTPAPYVYWDYKWNFFEKCIFSESGFYSSYLKIISCQNDFRAQFVCRATSIAGTDEKEMAVLTSVVAASDLNANCGNYDKFNNSFGKIRFPSIGIVYSNIVECRWLIDVAPNILRVEINNIDMEYNEYNDKCIYDYVAFYDDRANENEISRHCSNKNVVLYCKSGILYIKVVTNAYIYASGFTLTWNSTTAENSQVLVSPKIKNEIYFSGIYYADKSSATFKCEASGTPAPYVYWDYQWILFKYCIFSESGFNSSYLKITSCQDNFRKQFVCCATSIAGTDKKFMDLSTSDPPFATGFLVLFPLSSSSFILKWPKIRPNYEGYKVTMYFIEYYITKLGVSNTTKIVIPPNDSYLRMNYILSGLISDEYTVKVYAKNIFGSGPPTLQQADPSNFDYINRRKVFSNAQQNFLETLNVLNNEYTLSFNIKSVHFSESRKMILQLAFENITKGCSQDFLSIGILDDGLRKLVINSSENTITHIVIDLPTSDQWSNIKILQQELTTGLLFAVSRNGVTVYRNHFYTSCDEKNKKNTKVHVSNPCYSVQNDCISDLLIVNGKADYHVGNINTSLSQGKKIAEIPILDKEYLISFEVFPLSFSDTFGNILHFDNFGYKDLTNNGILKIDFSNNRKLYIQFKDVEKYITEPVKLNEWCQIEILQTLKSSKYIYMIKINEEIVFYEINNKAEIFLNVKVYASSQCEFAHNGFIKNFFSTSNKGYINHKDISLYQDYRVVNDTAPLVKGQLIAHIPKLYNEYFVSFDVYPQMFDDMKNVIDFTVGSYSQNNNKSVLGIWFLKHDEQRGLLGITSYSFEHDQDLFIHSSPIEQNVWTNIEINQTKNNLNYEFTIKINEVIVFSKTIKQVNSFENVNVYASNTWNENAHGSIRNLFIVNGNLKDQPEKVKILSNVCDLCVNVSHRCNNDTGFPYCECSIGYTGDGYTCALNCSEVCGPNQQCVVKNNTCSAVSSDLVQTSNLTVILVSVLVALIIIVIIVVVVLRTRRRKEIWNEDFYAYENNVNYYKTAPDEWDISPKKLVFNEKIGAGAFGKVFSAKINAKAFLKTMFAKQSGIVSHDDNNDFNVAVKVLKGGANQSEFDDFCEEIDLMKGIGYHKYIVSMIGCSRVKAPLCLVLEYMENGDLLNFLKNNRTKLQTSKKTESFIHTKSPKHLETSKLIEKMSLLSEVITTNDLLRFAWQIASGMEYLSSIKLVHRDLAARNILVGATKNVKISDFGLSRKVNEKYIYVGCKNRRLPIRWMSVEAIRDHNFTTYSDVWAYGIVLFEIVTLGGSPYPTMGYRELIQRLKSGYRMERPENCSQPMYDTMLRCWNEDPSQRPTFTDLRKHFEEIISRGDSCLSFDIDEGNNYYKVPSFHSNSSASSDDLGEVFEAPILETSV